MAEPTFYRHATMAELAANAEALGLTHDTSLGATQVAVPSFKFGTPFLERWPVRELPARAHWRDASYTSSSSWVFTIPDARIHSTAGIVCVGGFVIAETLANCNPAEHCYTETESGIWLDAAETDLGGTHVSVLTAGAPDNHYHTMIDGIGRLSVVPGAVLSAADGLIAPSDRSAPVSWLLDRVAKAAGLQWTTLRRGKSLRVERLVLAGPHSADCDFHPALAAWFDARASDAAPRSGTPPAFYIDRRRAAARPLSNETELIASLRPLGVEPVTLETLSLQDQIALFRNARLVIAPHGAGLANLVFARSRGCRVIELQMDAYCNWLFRRLAAIKQLRYDCILGRSELPWRTMDRVRASRWQVSVPHVVAAVQSVMALR